MDLVSTTHKDEAWNELLELLKAYHVVGLNALIEVGRGEPDRALMSLDRLEEVGARCDDLMRKIVVEKNVAQESSVQRAVIFQTEVNTRLSQKIELKTREMQGEVADQLSRLHRLKKSSGQEIKASTGLRVQV